MPVLRIGVCGVNRVAISRSHTPNLAMTKPRVITAILVLIHARNVRSFARYSVAFLSSGNEVRNIVRGLANSPKLTADSSLTESIAVAATPPSDDKADECSDPGADGYRFIRMLMHGFVGGLRGLDHLVPGPARDFLGMFKCGGQALATKALPSSRSLTISLPIACVYLFMFLGCPYLLILFNDDLSALAAGGASGKPATFRTEFLPPNGLGTVSRACGSGIHRPSTTRQYS